VTAVVTTDAGVSDTGSFVGGSVAGIAAVDVGVIAEVPHPDKSNAQKVAPISTHSGI
jgi:hypothetical protein